MTKTHQNSTTLSNGFFEAGQTKQGSTELDMTEATQQQQQQQTKYYLIFFFFFALCFVSEVYMQLEEVTIFTNKIKENLTVAMDSHKYLSK